ncbi:MAG: ABC transporter substrate-binding protein [Methanomicrobiales archaeon]|nr:ABC transporter substrate-binding protein [Methanomicrobiales archaeon]
MRKRYLFAIPLLFIAILVGAGCLTQTPTANTVGIIYSKGTGPMPTLLATGQVDGYIAWQPFVEVAPLANIGKVVVYSGELPPAGRWKNHPCCVLTSREDVLARNPGLVDTLTTATILATKYINENQNESAEIVADWLAGKGNFTYGNITVSSVDVLERAIPTVKFTNEPTESWMNGQLEFIYALRELKTLPGKLSNVSDPQAEQLLFETGPYQRASAMLNNGTIAIPPKEQKQVGVGYLMSDHHAALFVAVKKWQYFNDTYGIALKPQDSTQTRPEIVDLIVHGEKVAELKLIPGDAGPQLMQLASTDIIQFAYVGNPPAISAIDQGTPIKILIALNNEGSGLVVSRDAPVTDWPSFATWAKERAAEGKPLKIAAPGKGSIQDVLLRYALEESGLIPQEI